MGARRRTGGRREPLFDATPTPGMNLRLSPDDRPGAAPAERRAPAARREKVRERAAANDDAKEAKRPQPKPRRARRGRVRGGGGRGGGRGRLVRRLAYWAAVLALWAGIGGIAVTVWVFAHLPPIQSLEVPKRPPSVQLIDVNGAGLATRGEMGGAAVPLRELPKHLPQAFLAIEDRRFYDHVGVDIFGVARALMANLLRRNVSQGGSTITQQLAKNLFLTQERTFARKLQELALAFWLERKFTKAQILELYVNRVYFGAGAYGVEAASQRYFGKSARAVTLGEAALLAGLVKSPSKLAPTRNPEGAASRARLVLAAMGEAGFISTLTARAAGLEQPKIAVNFNADTVNYAADFVMDVLNDVVGRLDADVIVETTIDRALQTAAERALTEELAAKGQKFGVEQGAFIAMTPTGAVRALIGGKNYAESQFNRAIAAKRQPGSAFKPFVYLAALERGLTPETLRDDRPINLRGWRPENYSREYFGQVPLARALSMSLNTVAVRLTLEVGPKAVVQTAHRLGIASKLEPNASIALGTSEVSLLEMASAFAPFANGGAAVAPYIVTRVRTAAGKTLYRAKPETLGRVVEPRAVGMMNAMMRETLLSGTARTAALPGWSAAGKTGTSQEFRDAWFVGYTAHLIAAVWLGNDDSSPTKRTTGGGLPVDIWSRFMRAAHERVAPSELPGLGPRFAPPAAPAPPAPTPPELVAQRGATPPTRQASAQAPPAQAPTLDRWLLDTVFGRR